MVYRFYIKCKTKRCFFQIKHIIATLCTFLHPPFFFAQINSPVTPSAPVYQSVPPEVLNKSYENASRPAPGANYYNQSQTRTTSSVNSNAKFEASYKAPAENTGQDKKTQSVIEYYSAIHEDNDVQEDQLWKKRIFGFRFANPQSAAYKAKDKFYRAAFDSVNEMLSGKRPPDLKKTIFMVENAWYANKASYKEFSEKIEAKVRVIKQIIRQEKLDSTNNLALNYAIQKLFSVPVRYKAKNGTIKVNSPFTYDFDDYEGAKDYSKQFVSKLLYTGKGQCHSMPLLYLILAQEIGAKASIAYSPHHSYIAFPDNSGNWYNFECTSGMFTSYSFIMGSGYIKAEAVKSGIYTVPAALKQLIAGQLTDLANQHHALFGMDDFQLQCAKKTLEYFPNNIMAISIVSNHQTAKTGVAIHKAGYPKIADFNKYPGLRKEFEKRNELYSYMDNLGYAEMPDEAYAAWLKNLKKEQAKRESAEIRNIILTKAKM